MTETLIKERGILFKAEMVRAILAYLKTQTRRIVKPGPSQRDWLTDEFLQYLVNPQIAIVEDALGVQFDHPKGGPGTWIRCPQGNIGDRLYVKETYAQIFPELNGPIEYRASYQDGPTVTGGWKPSIFMPRSASRILLEITDVRVERLTAISGDDAVAEGIESWLEDMDGAGYLRYYKDYQDSEGGWDKPILSYQSLWESINGVGSWELNPWVWCLTFKVV